MDPAVRIHFPPFRLFLLFLVMAILTKQLQIIPAISNCRIIKRLICQRHLVVNFQRPVR